ncbi:MAG: sensor histidine kinase [Lachnospiraceae bacterium]|nr:sensor histidine kinase [Lachnospiraceae bacterium]
MDDKKKIISLQEQEQRRIANDLHDTTVQELVHLSQQLELAQAYMDKDMIQAKLEISSARRNIKSIIQNMRDTIYQLRPMSFDDLGWKLALERLQQEIQDKSDTSVIFNIDDLEGVDHLILISIYRILKEACVNVYKHACASELVVSIKKCEENIDIIIRDNGRGFDVNKVRDNHFGLQMMKERVELLSGTMKIDSTGEGTVIHINISYV